MKARSARKVLARWAAAGQGGVRVYRSTTTGRALRRYQRAVHQLGRANGGRLDWTQSHRTWRWAWQLRAEARKCGIKGRLAWLALRREFAARVRAHMAGGRVFPALARRGVPAGKEGAPT